MKVYVDELPKSCNDCNFKVFIAYHQSGWEHSERYCSIMKDSYDCRCSKERCPLQSLSDHDKRTRKQVCDEIRNKLLFKLRYDINSKVPIIEVCNKINEVLDKVEKG
jgi:hypothetical protein